MSKSVESGRGDDMTCVHDLWLSDKASYAPELADKVRTITLDGKDYQVRLSFLDLEEVNTDIFPSNRRAVTEIAPDLTAVHDVVVPVLPGWSETSAQFEGDFLVTLLRSLREHGYENPKIVGVNASGRGTREYLEPNRAKMISRIGLDHELLDVYQMVLALDEQDLLGDNMMLVGHSMGALNSMAFLEAVLVQQQTQMLRRDVSARVSRVVQMMPVTDKPYGMFRPGFIWAVRNQIWPACFQYFARRGHLRLNREDYARMMLSGKLDDAHFARSVPDSARRFLELTFNPGRKFENLFEDGLVDRVRFTVVEGIKDSLIPSSVVRRYGRDLADRVDGHVEGYFMGSFPHAVPFKMNHHQKNEIDQLWSAVLKPSTVQS